MKATLEIPDEVFQQLKAKAALEGRKLKDVVASALKFYLRQPVSKEDQGPAKPSPFPILRGKGGPLLRHMGKETIAKLQEDEDLEHSRRSCRH